MKAAIFNPYLDTLGGGERYTMSFAKVLLENGYKVDLEWNSRSVIEKIEKRFGINIDGINIVENIKRGEGYDLCFWLSDGSIPLLKSRNNILHFQFPFKDTNGNFLLNKMKFFRVGSIVCNSYFTKRFVDKEYGVKSIVIYPPVDVEHIKPKRKENIILSVGRFSQLTQAKNQDFLISAFKKLLKGGIEGWRLILAGGTEVGVTESFFKKLTESARNYPIQIIENPNYKELYKLYGISKIFWAATGYGISEEKDPEKVEHFGIAVVEAMAAGCVPCVFEAGGFKEIISDDYNGLLWKKESELVRKSKLLIGNQKRLRSLAQVAKESSKIYEYQRFKAEVEKIIF